MFHYDFLGSFGILFIYEINVCAANFIYLPRDLNLTPLQQRVSLSNSMSISELCEDESAFCINHSFNLSVSLCPPSTQITVIQAHEQNIIPPFDIVVLQSHSDASQLITLCTLKYTNACVRSFVNKLLFNYNFTWTLLISGANRVSSSARNYSGFNCSACLWNMLVSQQGHHTYIASVLHPFWQPPWAAQWHCLRTGS